MPYKVGRTACNGGGGGGSSLMDILLSDGPVTHHSQYTVGLKCDMFSEPCTFDI
jgi:hypothetical protein